MGRARNGVRGVDTILLQVSDPARSLRFWRDGLGIAFPDPRPGRHATRTKVGEVTLLLHRDFERGLGTMRGKGIALHLRVADVDAAYAEIRGRGVEPDGAPVDHPWGREFSVTDPDGYRIEFIGSPVKRGRGKRRRRVQRTSSSRMTARRTAAARTA